MRLLNKYDWKPKKANLFQDGIAESIYYLINNWKVVLKYIDEFVEIGNTKGFTRSRRTKTIGKKLCEIGGTGLMQEVFKIIVSLSRTGPVWSYSSLDNAWDGIDDGKSDWRA